MCRDVRQTVPRSTPYSDAYMSGQPSKRRKLSKEKKPRGEVRDVIADALQVPYIFLHSIMMSVTQNVIF